MNKLFLLLFSLILCISTVFAYENTDYIKYNGDKYFLLYSGKSKEHNGYYNQYFKKGEDFDSWTEMIAIQHFPNVYSPIDLAHTFREYLGEYSCPSALWVDEDKNMGVLDFILIDDKSKSLPIKLEFNVFKYSKSPICGSVSMQYARKYDIYDVKKVEIVKKMFEKYRPKAIHEIKMTEIPNIVNEDIGEINLNDLP